MSLLSRRTKIVLAVLFLFTAGSVFMVLRGRSFFTNVPDEFTQARLQGASISQSIVELSGRVPSDLEKVNELDSQQKFADAVTATNDLVTRSQEIRDKAAELSRELEIMTRALPDVKSEAARQAALDSIANRVTLIMRLISYSTYLSQLLDTLRNKFSGVPAKDHEVSKLIAQINGEVIAINSFNKQGTDAMNRFDEIVKSGK